MEFPYISKGESVIRALISEEKDKLLATASLEKLKQYIPNIDTEKNVDLLGIAFNIFVANRFNKNGDVSDSKTSVALAKSFAPKPINIEHKREKVAGVVLNYAFTKFGSNETMTEEEALATTEPFNVTLGGVIWRIVNQKLAQLIEDCSDPTSENYEKISASWEIGFMDFAIASVEGESRNLSDAQIITDKEEIKKLQNYLRAFGGKGSKGNQKLYRLIYGDALPLGVGLTSSPAGDVLGIATDSNDEKEIVLAEETKKNIENISQNKENIVIEERKAFAMRITKIEDITDDFLKQSTASEITEWVKEQLRAANTSFTEEKTKLEKQVVASQEAADKLSADYTKLQEEFKKINESLAGLQTEKEARARQDAFNVRMAGLDADFDLNEAEREIIAQEIINFDDTAFAAYRKKLDVLLAAKKKGCKAKAGCGESQKEEKKEAKASTNEGDAKTIVEQAVENAETKTAPIAAAATAQPPSVFEKFQKAFGVDQWISDVKLTD